MDGRATLFRERNGWCPYSHRVWLAFEYKKIPYNTVLIDNMGSRPSWYRGTTPQVTWGDGRSIGESDDILRALDREFPDASRKLFPKECKADIERIISEFQRCFPKGTRPSSRAAYLFRNGGGPVFRSDFEAALDATDALLSETSDEGPFFCGNIFTAADCAWAPFLERYAAQLPLLHCGLQPKGGHWRHVAAWFEAMESLVPAYCCCQGDVWSWAKVLRSAGYGNGGTPTLTLGKEAERLQIAAVAIADAYAARWPLMDTGGRNDDDDNIRKHAEAHQNWAAQAKEVEVGGIGVELEPDSPAGSAARLLVHRRIALAAAAHPLRADRVGGAAHA